MTREEPTKSNLIKLLQLISRGSTPRVGLVPVKEQRVAALALIVAPDKPDAQIIAAAVEAGADALVVEPAQAMAQWKELTAAAGGKPIGLQVGQSDLSVDQVKQFAEQADFVIADVDQAPATLLESEAVAKVLSVDDDYAPHLIRTLGELPIDAVLAKSKAAGADALSVRDLLHFRQVVDLIRRPVIGMAGLRFSPRLLNMFRDMGLEAVLLPVETAAGASAVRATVEEYRKAIDELGRPIGRAWGPGQAWVPHLRGAGAPPKAEPDEDPDDE